MKIDEVRIARRITADHGDVVLHVNFDDLFKSDKPVSREIIEVIMNVVGDALRDDLIDFAKKTVSRSRAVEKALSHYSYAPTSDNDITFK